MKMNMNIKTFPFDSIGWYRLRSCLWPNNHECPSNRHKTEPLTSHLGGAWGSEPNSVIMRTAKLLVIIHAVNVSEP